MTTPTTLEPIETLQGPGGLKATIRKLSCVHGTFYSVTLCCEYVTEKGLEDLNTFDEEALARVARLITRADDRIRELRAQDTAEERSAD